MQTTIYLIRHGQSQGNKQGVFLGHCDLPLTEQGIAQAQKTAAYLQTVPVDAIYASDLTRAYETACQTAILRDMPITKNENLREIYAGLWENVAFSALTETFSENYSCWLTNIGHARCNGGESVEELQTRIVSTLTDIAKRHEGQTVFVFTHATPIRVFAAHCLKKTVDEIKTVPWATNASVTKAIFDGNAFSLLEYSKDDFMGDWVTKFPANV